jgi:predicted 3-demethylubiquinone-9 3-methyltransferase (glyoxalase superfamily)
VRKMQKISTMLWFDDQAEEAAEHYVKVFNGYGGDASSRILEVSRYSDAGPGPAGQVMTVDFELRGQRFQALNGGDQGWTFNESISFVVHVEGQEEVDYFWNALTEGGEESQCGWLRDRYGVSWQIVPKELMEHLGNPDRAKANRAMAAMLQMKKIVIADLERAAEAA